VSLYLLSGFFVMHMLKGYFNNMAHVFNHILDITSRLRAVRVDQDLFDSGMILRVYLVSGCC